MTAYQPYLIAPFKTSLNTELQPWLLPQDAFQSIYDAYIHHGVLSKRDGVEFFGELVHSQIDITAITNANPGQVTVSSAAGLSEGQRIQINYATGMTSVNGGKYVITNLIGTTFDLYDTSGNPVDTSGFGVYTGSGILSIFPALPVMGLRTFVDNDNQRILVAMDTRRACVYDPNTNSFAPLDGSTPFTDYFSGDNSNFFSTASFGRTGSFGTSTLFMTNNVDTIYTYQSGDTTVSQFIPNTNPTGTANYVNSCKFIFSIRQRLVLMGTLEGAVSGTGGTYYNQRQRWSQAQNPTVWDDVTPGNGGYVDAPTSEVIIGTKSLQDLVITHFTQSVWMSQPTSDPALPFRWSKINDFRACDAPYANIGHDRYVISFGKRGIVATDSVEVRRIDEQIQSFIQNEINTQFIQQLYSERNFAEQRSWTIYPALINDVNPDSTNAPETSNRALIRTEDEGAWSIYRIAFPPTTVDGITYSDGINFSSLGFGETTRDLAWEDFNGVLASDNSWAEFDEETWQSYFLQSDSELFLGGDQIGRVYILEDSDSGSDDGNPINFELTSAAWNPYKDQGIQAQLGYVDFYVDADTDTQFTVEFFTSDINNPYATQTLDCLPPLGFIADIQDITLSNPVQITAASNGLETGDQLFIYNLNGAENLTGGPYTVTVVDENNFTLDGVDGTGFETYISGGTLVLREFENTKCWKRAYAGGKGYLHYVRITNTGTNDILRFNAFMPWFRQCGTRMIG